MNLKKPGTKIEGWRKQPKGHWYNKYLGQRARIVNLRDYGGWHITCRSSPHIPADVARDLLAQIDKKEGQP